MAGRLLARIGYPLAGVILLVALWAFLCAYLNIPTVVLPTH